VGGRRKKMLVLSRNAAIAGDEENLTAGLILVDQPDYLLNPREVNEAIGTNWH
jgi:hypothetical protein